MRHFNCTYAPNSRHSSSSFEIMLNLLPLYISTCYVAIPTPSPSYTTYSLGFGLDHSTCRIRFM